MSVSLECEVDDKKYAVEAALGPDGSAVFSFEPPLPQRTKSIGVPADVVEDIVRTSVVTTTFSAEKKRFSLTLEFVDFENIEDNGDLDCRCATEFVAEKEVLELVLDILVEPCPDCGELHFGDDIQSTKPPKNYVN